MEDLDKDDTSNSENNSDDKKNETSSSVESEDTSTALKLSVRLEIDVLKQKLITIFKRYIFDQDTFAENISEYTEDMLPNSENENQPDNVADDRLKALSKQYRYIIERIKELQKEPKEYKSISPQEISRDDNKGSSSTPSRIINPVKRFLDSCRKPKSKRPKIQPKTSPENREEISKASDLPTENPEALELFGSKAVDHKDSKVTKKRRIEFDKSMSFSGWIHNTLDEKINKSSACAFFVTDNLKTDEPQSGQNRNESEQYNLPSTSGLSNVGKSILSDEESSFISGSCDGSLNDEADTCLTSGSNTRRHNEKGQSSSTSGSSDRQHSEKGQSGSSDKQHSEKGQSGRSDSQHSEKRESGISDSHHSEIGQSGRSDSQPNDAEEQGGSDGKWKDCRKPTPNCEIC